MSVAQVIILNGPCSAGKTSIARELQRIMNPPHLWMGIDDMMASLPNGFFAVEPPPGHPAHQGIHWRLPLEPVERDRVMDLMRELGSSGSDTGRYACFQEALERLGLREHIQQRGMAMRSGAAVHKAVKGMHRAIAALAQEGNHLVIDHVLFEEDWLDHCVRSLTGISVLFVGVRCPIEELERREYYRGNRILGSARGHFETVHSHGAYDLEVDTSRLTAAQCAERIKERLENGSPPTAFTRLAMNSEQTA